MLSTFIVLYCDTYSGSMQGLLAGLVCGIAASSGQDAVYAAGFGIAGFLAGFFGEKKPTRKELASVALAFLGMLALFAIPI